MGDYHGRDQGPLTGVMSISGGETFTCAAREEGTAHCWGYGYDGNLGNGQSLDDAQRSRAVQTLEA